MPIARTRESLYMYNTLTASLQRSKTPSRLFWVMTLKNLMLSLQECWTFGGCSESVNCHCSQVHSGLV